MPKKVEETNNDKQVSSEKDMEKEEIERLNRMLSAVIDYISDDEVEVIDIEYLLNSTEGLREWWEKYQEKNRKKLEEEIRKSLSGLSLDDLEKIREQIKGKSKE